MKYTALSLVSALALASLGSGVKASPLPQVQTNTQSQPNAQQAPSSGSQGSQYGSAGGFGGSASATQNNDYSQVAPGNTVMNGGGQSASLQGLAGTVMQGGNVASLLGRRQLDVEGSQKGSAAGYAGHSSAYQNNDYSAVAPGNSVELGGSQSASNQGTSGTVDQSYNGQMSSNVRRSIPNDASPTDLLSLFQNGLPTEMLARDVDESDNSNGVYLVSTKFGPVTSSQSASPGSIPHYMGLGPEVQPAPRPAL